MTYAGDPVICQLKPVRSCWVFHQSISANGGGYTHAPALAGLWPAQLRRSLTAAVYALMLLTAVPRMDVPHANAPDAPLDRVSVQLQLAMHRGVSATFLIFA